MKSIVICGSKRFKPEIIKLAHTLEKAGCVVHAPFLHKASDEWQTLSDQYKKFIAMGLTLDHFYKIKMADIVYIYNKNGYAGVSTTLEIGCAVALGKPIYALSDKDEEMCRLVLFKDIIKTPSQLLKILK